MSRLNRNLANANRQSLNGDYALNSARRVFWFGGANATQERWHNPSHVPTPIPIDPPLSEIVPTIDTKQFFDRTMATGASENDDFAYYYSAEIHSGFRHVIRDVTDRLKYLDDPVSKWEVANGHGRDHSPRVKQLIDTTTGSAREDEPSDADRMTPQSATFVWVGGRNITAQTHYDEVHNLYVQLSGNKKFIISPPSGLHSLYLHPDAHAYDRQSQVDHHSDIDILRSEAHGFTRFGSASALVAELTPGDVLYLPPFWFHRVSSSPDTPISVSMNVWTDSGEGERSARALSLGGAILHGFSGPPAPSATAKTMTEALRADARTIDALRVFLTALLNGVMKHPSPLTGSSARTATEFARDLYETRYKPQAELFGCVLPSESDADAAREEAIRRSTASHIPSVQSVCTSSRVNTAMVGEIEHVVLSLVELYRHAYGDPKYAGVGLVAIEKLVEQTIYTTLGLYQTCPFLQFCM